MSFTLHREAFRRQVLNAPWMVEAMRARAERGKAFAEAIAPDAPPYGEGYIASFEVEAGTDGGIHGDRAYGILRNTSPHAVYVEYGNGHTEGEKVLHRALDVMG